LQERRKLGLCGPALVEDLDRRGMLHVVLHARWPLVHRMDLRAKHQWGWNDIVST
jgi:hypothetical protein